MTDSPQPYEAPIDLRFRNDSHTLAIEQVLATAPAGGKVLEVGCATGMVGATLRSRGLHVTGIEPMASAAALAQPRLDEVFVGTAEGYFERQPGSRFDCIVFGDVLEHLADPAAELRRAASHLSAQGGIVISVPNVTHGSVRAMLLEGRWDTAQTGILDRTHLRWFSRQGLIGLCTESGLAVDYLGAVTLRTRASNRQFALGLQRRSMAWVELICPDAEQEVFQFVLRARPSAQPDLAQRNAPWAVPGAPLDIDTGTRPRSTWRRRASAAAVLLRTGWRSQR